MQDITIAIFSETIKVVSNRRLLAAVRASGLKIGAQSQCARLQWGFPAV
jgi:hypothetical protein